VEIYRPENGTKQQIIVSGVHMAISNKKQIHAQFSNISVEAKYLLKLLEIDIWGEK
jgi:hypothetical protein